MPTRTLITGGAGFIGSFVADELLAARHEVRVLDNLAAQVHGDAGRRPPYLDPRVELCRADVRDEDAVARALRDVDAVIHFAAAVGVGQSMYAVSHYVSVNDLGTAVLLEQLARRPVGRLVVASSMSVYGEGLYRGRDGQPVEVGLRPRAKLERGRWDPLGPRGEPLEPMPTPETKHPALASVYALSKYDQERMCLLLGEAYGIPTVALRFFNVYGPRQALSNPYTGVLAIFAARLLNDRPPLVFEDGRQRRDFVNVRDVALATRLALEQPSATGEVLNIGSGESRTVLEVAHALADVLGRHDIAPEVTSEYRVGDIRHCFADITRAQRVLGFRPRVSLEAGLHELSRWLVDQTADDRVSEARRELGARGLTVGVQG